MASYCFHYVVRVQSNRIRKRANAVMKKDACLVLGARPKSKRLLKKVMLCLEYMKFITGMKPLNLINGWLVGCFGFNGPLRQYFSLYQAVSQREGERGEKG